MPLAAVPLAVVLTVFTLTLTTPATTQEIQESTTPGMPESNQPDNNCTFTVVNSTYDLNEGEIKSVIDEVGRSFTWYLCEGGALQSDTVSCVDTNQCANVTLGSITDDNNTCVDCHTLYENCVNETETDNNNSNETSEMTDEEIANAKDDTHCSDPERGTDDCSRNPAYMFENCCNFCYMQRLAPMSENSNDTLESARNNGEI